MASIGRSDRCNPHNPSSYQGPHLGGRRAGLMQRGGSPDYCRIDPLLLRRRLRPWSAAPCDWLIRGGSRRDCCIWDWGSSYLPFVPRAIGPNAQHLATLVCLRCSRHHRCCTTGDWSRCSCAATVAVERNYRRHSGTRGARDNDCMYYLAAARALGDGIPDHLAVSIFLWLAARCDPAFSAAGAFVVSMTIVLTTILGVGHFGDPSLPITDRVLGAQ